MTQIRVMLTGPSLSQSAGGIVIHVANLMEIFSRSATISLTHFAHTDAKYNRESWGKKIVRLFKSLGPFIRQLKRCEVVHFNSTFDNRSVVRDLFYAAIATFIIRRKVVIQFHGGEPFNVAFFKHKPLRFICKAILLRAAFVLVLSKFQQDQFENSFPEIQTTLIPNCVSNIKPLSKKSPHEGIIFLFMGRIAESKGVLNIVAAARDLARKSHKFKINICGTGPLQQLLVDKITSDHLQSHVEYLGFVSGEAKEKILHESDVMLLPTNHNEGFPYALLEAFSYAMPVIGTRKGAIADVLADKEDGFIIEADNIGQLTEKMAYFCADPAQIEIMGTNARNKLSQKYSSDVLSTKLTAIYSS